MIDITVLNVLNATPLELSEWVSEKLLNIQIPTFGLNSTVTVKADILPLLPHITNRITFATSLYSMCIAAKAVYSNQKKHGTAEEKALVADKIASLSACIDILYRSIQSLESQRETTSRLMTGLSKDYTSL